MPVCCGCVALCQEWASQKAQDKTHKHTKDSAWDMTQKVHISNNVGEGETEGTRCGVRSGICSRRGGGERRVDQTGLKPESSGLLFTCYPPTDPTRIGQRKHEGQQQLEGRRVLVISLWGVCQTRFFFRRRGPNNISSVWTVRGCFTCRNLRMEGRSKGGDGTKRDCLTAPNRTCLLDHF